MIVFTEKAGVVDQFSLRLLLVIVDAHTQMTVDLHVKLLWYCIEKVTHLIVGSKHNSPQFKLLIIVQYLMKINNVGQLQLTIRQ